MAESLDPTPLFNRGWDHLPNELLWKIFFYLQDADLLRSVIPVCRRFRRLAYAWRFRYPNGSLGHDWCRWYRLSEEFLRAIQKPEALEFTTCAECRIEADEEVISAVKILNVEKLSIDISQWTSSVDISLEPEDDEESQHNRFIPDLLSVTTNLKELDLGNRLSERRFTPYSLRVEDLVQCSKDLRKLRLDSVTPESFCYLTQNFVNLTHFECCSFSHSDLSIQELRFLPRLSSLALGDLKVRLLTPAGFDKLFSQNEGSFGKNLRFLSICYENRDYVHSFIGFDRALERCAELEELHLCLSHVSKFDLGQLKKLRVFDLKAKTGRPNEPSLLPINPSLLESISTNFPNLTSLQLHVDFLYPTTCPDEKLSAIFGKMEHFKFSNKFAKFYEIDEYGEIEFSNEHERNESQQFIGRLLPFCSDGVLKSLDCDGLIHTDPVKHPNLKLIGTLKLQKFSSSVNNLPMIPSPQTSFSFFSECDWSQLTVLKLGMAQPWCFPYICDNCPFLRSLEIQTHLDGDTIPGFDLNRLKSLTRLETLYLTARYGHVASTRLWESGDVEKKRSVIFKACNSALPRDPDGDRLVNFPAMKSFSVTHSNPGRGGPLAGSTDEFRWGLKYDVNRTCIGDIRRSIRIFSKRKTANDSEFVLKPSDISTDSDIPEQALRYCAQHDRLMNNYFKNKRSNI